MTDQSEIWAVTEDAGFLLPDPVQKLAGAETGLRASDAVMLDVLAKDLPDLVEAGTLRATLRDLPIIEMDPQSWSDARVVERAFQIYAHLANVHVWCVEAEPEMRLPPGVAVPLVTLANAVGRPPIVSYAGTALANHIRPEGATEYLADDMRCIQKIVDIPDESWFHLIHVEIEARGGPALAVLARAQEACATSTDDEIADLLAPVPEAIDSMAQTFRRITERCRTDVYYHTLRPYLFGFEGVIYEGVAALGEKPQHLRGETGAQSSLIPAIVGYLGIEHERGGLTEHMVEMRGYMPTSHRAYLDAIDTRAIRARAERGSPVLREVYDACLDRLAAFRSLHLAMARAFIADKVDNAMGTGGTDFMQWLAQLRDETRKQHLKEPV